MKNIIWLLFFGVFSTKMKGSWLVIGCIIFLKFGIGSQERSYHGWCAHDNIGCLCDIRCIVDTAPPNHVVMLVVVYLPFQVTCFIRNKVTLLFCVQFGFIKKIKIFKKSLFSTINPPVLALTIFTRVSFATSTLDRIISVTNVNFSNISQLSMTYHFSYDYNSNIEQCF